MGVDLSRIIVFCCFLTILDKEFRTALEKMRKIMFVLTFESFKIIMYIILKQKFNSV